MNKLIKENNLSEYDEFELLMLSNGRCAQDELYLEELSEADMPEEIVKRYEKKIEDIVPLQDYSILVFFRDGTIKKCDLKNFINKNKALETFLSLNKERFSLVHVQPGGYGIRWEENMCISDIELYESGIQIPLSLNDFREFAVQRVINAAEAAEMLDCSRQNINDLIKRNKLHPLKASPKSTLFLKSEILKRKWQ